MNINKILLERILFETVELEKLDIEIVFGAIRDLIKLSKSWTKYAIVNDRFLYSEKFEKIPYAVENFVKQTEFIIDDLLHFFKKNSYYNPEDFDKIDALYRFLNAVNNIFLEIKNSFDIKNTSPKQIKVFQLIAKELNNRFKFLFRFIKTNINIDKISIILNYISENFKKILDVPIKQAQLNYNKSIQNLKVKPIIQLIDQQINKLIDSDRFTDSSRNENKISLLRTAATNLIFLNMQAGVSNLYNTQNFIERLLQDLSTEQISKSFINKLIDLTREISNNSTFGAEYVR